MFSGIGLTGGSLFQDSTPLCIDRSRDELATFVTCSFMVLSHSRFRRVSSVWLPSSLMAKGEVRLSGKRAVGDSCGSSFMGGSQWGGKVIYSSSSVQCLHDTDGAVA
jgi:hypothetical protein